MKAAHKERPFVLDCSVTMAWCFADQANKLTHAALESLTKREALVPSIWLLEVTNVLVVAEKRKLLSRHQSQEFLDLLRDLPIRVEGLSQQRTFVHLVDLARRHSLSTYDAAYLDLAIREDIPLVTTDAALKRAAKRAKLPTFAG